MKKRQWFVKDTEGDLVKELLAPTSQPALDFAEVAVKQLSKDLVVTDDTGKALAFFGADLSWAMVSLPF